MTKNNVILDRLDEEDLKYLEKLDDYNVVQILDGDESMQFALGEAWTLDELQTFEPGDKLLSSYVDESKIPFPYRKYPAHYKGEWFYECMESATVAA